MAKKGYFGFLLMFIKTDKLSIKITIQYLTLKYNMYEGCSNMNESSLITFVTYMLRQNGIRFYKGLYFTFKLAPAIKKNTVYLSSYIPLN